MPASVASGDMLIALVGEDSGAASNTWDNSFTELLDSASATGIICAVAYKIASGGETSVVATHTTERSNHIALRIPAAEWANDGTAPEISTIATGNNANPNPNSISPSWGTTRPTILIAAMFADDSAPPFPVTAYPTNYNDNQVSNNTATSASAIACATSTATITIQDPGAFTMTGTETWGAVVIAVKGVASGNTVNIDAALTASATISPAAILTLSIAAALVGSAVVSPAADLTLAIGAALVGSATISPAATMTATIAAALDASAVLASTAGLLLPIESALTASAAIAVAAEVFKTIEAVLTATAAVSPSANVTARGEAALTGTASLVPDAVIMASGAAALSASASVAADARITASIAAALQANATIAAAGVLVLSGAAALSAVATLVADGQITGGVVVGDAVLVFSQSMIAVLTLQQAHRAGITFPD